MHHLLLLLQLLLLLLQQLRAHPKHYADGMQDAMFCLFCRSVEQVAARF
jgi:hypothetical protein